MHQNPYLIIFPNVHLGMQHFTASIEIVFILSFDRRVLPVCLVDHILASLDLLLLGSLRLLLALRLTL